MPPKKKTKHIRQRSSALEMSIDSDEESGPELDWPSRLPLDSETPTDVARSAAGSMTASAQQGALHQSTSRGVVASNMDDESASALFVCSMCVQVKPDSEVLLYIYSEDSTFMAAVPLDPVDNASRYVFEAMVPIKMHKPLRGRVVVYSSGGGPFFENVVASGKENPRWECQNKLLRRMWQCNALPQVLTAVVRDRFTNYSPGYYNFYCSNEEFIEGWLRLLKRLTAEFVGCNTIADFVSAFASVVHSPEPQVQRRWQYGGNGRASSPDVPIVRPLIWLLDSVRKNGSAAEEAKGTGRGVGGVGRRRETQRDEQPLSDTLLMRWMHLVKVTEGLVNSRLTADRNTFAELNRFDIYDAFGAIMAEPVNGNFRTTAAAFITRLISWDSNGEDSIPWALLRLALSPDAVAERLLKRHPLEAVPYLFLLKLPGVDPKTFSAVLSCFPNFRVLRGSLEVLPAEAICRIVGSPAYRMPTDPAQAREEYSALMYFLLESGCADSGSEIGNDCLLLRLLSSQRHLCVDSEALAGCSIDERAELALIPLINKRETVVSRTSADDDVTTVVSALDQLIEKRCKEFKAFLQPQALSADANFISSVYNVLRNLVPYRARTPVLELGMREIAASLPALNSRGLLYRFVAYLREDDACLVALEAEAFTALCRNSSNDRAEMRMAFWARAQKVLRASTLQIAYFEEGWLRAARVLGDLWQECYQIAVQGLDDALSPTERALLHPLGFALEGVDAMLQFLMIQAVRDLYETLQSEISLQPLLRKEPRYAALLDSGTQVQNQVRDYSELLLAQHLLNENLKVVLKHSSLYKSIKYVVPSFDESVVQNALKKVENINAELDELLLVFQFHMPKHPSFGSCSAQFVRQVRQLAADLERTMLFDWHSPALGGPQVCELAHKLFDAQQSLLYVWVWEQQCVIDVVVSADPSEAIKQWMQAVQLSFDRWQKTVEQIENQSFCANDLRAIIGPIVEDAPEVPVFSSDPIGAGQEADRYTEMINAHFDNCAVVEVNSILRVLHKTRSMEKILREFATACTFLPQAESLQKLVKSLCTGGEDRDAHGSRPLDRFLHCMQESTNSSVLEVTEAFLALRLAYPLIMRIVATFPLLLNELIEEGLVELLKQYPDVSSLDQTVRRRAQETAGERELMLLMKVFEVRQLLETDKLPQGYPAFTGRCFPSAELLVEYLHHVSWCISSLRPLLGGLRLLEGLLSAGGASVASTVAVVHALIGAGEFVLTVIDQDVQISAVADLEREGKFVRTTFSPTRLGDIPFQLCMVGARSNSDDGKIQMHFLRVLEHLKLLRDALKKLTVSGHPNFQDRVLFVPGTITCAELKALTEEQNATFQRWQVFLSSYADLHLPLLSCFSRKQLVESLGFIGRPECIESTAHLLRAACSALPRSSAIQLAEVHLQQLQVQRSERGEDFAAEGGRPHDIFEQVHILLLHAIEYLVPRPCNTRAIEPLINNFMRTLPDRLKPIAQVNVLRLPLHYENQHNELACALFISTKHRLPASIEIFCCSEETDEQAARDFIRRWAAAQHFQELLPECSRSLLFCMLNVERLSAHVQGVLLGMMQLARKHNEMALLLLVSAKKDSDSLLCSGLRNDWVSCEHQLIFKHCLPLCAAFLKRMFPKVQVYKSATASSGKTTAVLRDHLLGRRAQKDEDGQRKEYLTDAYSPAYASLSITGDADDAVELLRTVERDRLALSVQAAVKDMNHGSLDLDAGGLVLHLNVSSHFDVAKLNRFLLKYLITGVLMDSKGGHVVRYAADTVAVEWPSEGVLAEHAWDQCGLLSCFKLRSVKEEFHLDTYTFSPCLAAENPMDCVLYHMIAEDNPQLKTGLQLALSFFEVDRRNAFGELIYCEDVAHVPIPDPTTLYIAFAQQLTTTRAPLQSQTAVAEALPGQVYRFIRFLAYQLNGLSRFAYYQLASKWEEAENTSSRVPANMHSRNYRRLTFHLAHASVHLARLLAASAVGPPMTEDYDDDARLSNLQFSFDRWRETPFIIFSEDGDYSTISVTDTDIFATITARDTDPNFRAFIAQHQAQRAHGVVDMVTAGLTEDGYDPSTDCSESHALKMLLPMISEISNHATLIFRALQDQRLRGQPGTTIASMMHKQTGDVVGLDYHESAVQQLRRYAGADGLQDNNTFADFQVAAKQWFISITGSYDGDRAPFVLTRDNLIRLLTIKLRLICRIPVVFVGETGCGKTHLVSFLSKLSGQRMHTYNIYGGLKPMDVLAEMQSIVQRADGAEVVVLLDEINSSPNCWMLKMLLCDRSVLGRRIPSNVRFIAIMNPRRKRNVSAKVDAHGLDYSPYERQQHGTGIAQSVANVPHKPLLVYEVFQCPESVMQLVWDFGSPAESHKNVKEWLRICHNRTQLPAQLNRYITDEVIFCENLVHWMVKAKLKQFNSGEAVEDEHGVLHEVGLSTDFAACSGDSEGNARHYPYLRALLCTLIDTSQRFMRTEQGLQDKSAASLRDISRVVTQIPFLMHLQERHAEFYPDPAQRQNLYFSFLSAAVQASLVLNYALRIVDEEQRQEYFARIHSVWKQVRAGRVISPAFLPIPETPRKIYAAFDSLAFKLCSSLMRPKGIAINQALKENILSLFSAVMGDDGTGMFQFIVGRPGSTKSSSLDILCASTDPSSQDPRTEFFRGHGGWFSISKFLLQCTPDTTAQDILKLAHTAATAQRLNEQWRCIIVLEEVGVTLNSKHNPLMVLHNLIDRGVAMEDGSFVRLPIIGISNWQLDGSKMSRMRTTYRGNPSVHDLVKTAECIMEVAGTKVCAISNQSLQRFATVFCNLILSDQEKEISWFYGMRDFYAFVQFLQIHHAFPLSRELKLHGAGRKNYSIELDPHLVEWAVKISFGGHPNKMLDERVRTEILRCFKPDTQLWVQGVRWVRQIPVIPTAKLDGQIEAEVEERVRPHEGVEAVCDMCARMAHYVDKLLSASDFLVAADATTLFTGKFREYQSIACRCTQLDSASSFSPLSILSYCLNVYPAHLAIRYRVRHVLLFTRTNAGLHLLFSMEILQRDRTTIIFGRNNASDADKLEDLVQVRRCMQNGRVLVLVDAHHISESLYDALNQHYTPEGKGENRVEYTRLTMNGYTASFPIHPSFRCISIAQEQSARGLLPPYINRFTKAHLNYSSALSVAQMNVARSIREKCHVVVGHIQGIGSDVASASVTNTETANLMALLIPGFTTDTIESLTFQLRLQRMGDCDGLTISHAASACCKLLSYCIVPRRLLQLSYGFFQNLDGAQFVQVVSYWMELLRCRTHSLKEDYDDIQLLRMKAGSEIDPPHLFLFTEQLQLSPMAAHKALAALFPDCAPLSGANFSNLLDHTDKEMEQLVEQLREEQSGSYCCVYFDASLKGNSSSILVGRFMHLVNSAQIEANKHVVVIGVLGDSSRAGFPFDDLQLHFEELWNFMFIDQIVPDPVALERKDEREEFEDVDSMEEEQEDEVLFSLSELLSGESDALEHVLLPHRLCALIASRALSIAQCVERRNGPACSQLAALLLEVFSNPLDPVAQAISCKIHSGLKIIGGNHWRRTALQKVSHARSLLEHFLIFLRGFAERALLKFGTALFAFKNFQNHCIQQSPTRALFVYLLQCPAIVPEVSLATCTEVDLPLPLPLSDRDRHLLTGDSELFSDPSLPVRFPFSFLLAHVLHPIARSSGRAACQQKAQEILGEFEGASEVQDLWITLYVGDILTHTLQVADPEAQRGFIFLTLNLLLEQKKHSEVQGVSMNIASGIPQGQEEQEQSTDHMECEQPLCKKRGPSALHSDELGAWDRIAENLEPIPLQGLHMLLLEHKRWAEAAVRIVTAPGIDLPALYQSETGLSHTLLQATSLSTGIVPLYAISDIQTLTGDKDSYLILLHQAVATATSQEDENAQREAADLAWACCGHVQLLEKAFLRGDATALRLSKYLLPLMFLAYDEQPVPLLIRLVDWLSSHHTSIPRAAAGSIIRRALEWWLNQAGVSKHLLDPDYYPLVCALSRLVPNTQEADLPLAVLVSRCLFDYCKSDVKVLDTLHGVRSLALERRELGQAQSAEIDISSLCEVLKSGCVTAGLYLLVEELKERMMLDADERSTDVEYAAPLLSMRNALETELQGNADLAAAATLYTLRALSSGGVEIECAQRALREFAQYSLAILPMSVTSHSMCLELMREEESAPSAFHLLPAYTKSVNALLHLVNTVIPGSGALQQQCDNLGDQMQHNAAGIAAAVLEIGFCRAASVDSRLETKKQEVLWTTVLPLLPIGPDLQALCNVLLVDPPGATDGIAEMSPDHRRAFVTAAVLILGVDTPLFQPYRDIATTEGPHKDIPQPMPQPPVTEHSEASVAATSVSKYLLYSAHLIRLIRFSPIPPAGDVIRHSEHIKNEILLTRCPRCRQPFDSFDGCFSVSCVCRACFCAWCFTVFPDAHSHVPHCPLSLNKGAVHGTHEQFQLSCCIRHLQQIKEYLPCLDPGLQGPVLDACMKDLADISMPLHELFSITGYTTRYCLLQMKSILDDTKARNFPGSLANYPPVAWLQALLLLELIPSASECRSTQAAETIVQRIFNQTILDAHSLVDRLRADCERAIGDPSVLLGTVRWDATYEARVSTVGVPASQLLPHHFAYRTRATTQQFWYRVNNDPQLALLSFLGVREKSLAKSFGDELVLVLNKVGEIMRVCSASQMTRAEAGRTTLGELVARFPQLDSNQIAAFGAAMQNMYNRVQRWECSDRAKLDARFGHLRFDASLPIVYLLPHSKDEGLLMHVLYKGTADPLCDDGWQSLGIIQNTVVKRLVDSGAAPIRSAAHRPYSLSRDDLVSFSKHKQVYQHLLALYIEPQPIATFTSDLPNLQWQVLHSSGLSCKPTLADALPDFVYAEEQQHSVFGLLGGKMDQYGGILALTASTMVRLKTLVSQLPGSTQQVTSFLILLASELMSRPPFQTPDFLVDLAAMVPIELTPEQQAGMTILRNFAKELKPGHILALVEVLWDGALSPKCCEPLDDDSCEAVEMALNNIAHDPQTMAFSATLLSAFRHLGLQRLCVEQVEGFYESGFIDALEAVAVGPDLPAGLLRGGAVERVPMKHFQAVLCIAEKVLGSVALMAPDGTETPFEAEVTLESMRDLFAPLPAVVNLETPKSGPLLLSSVPATAVVPEHTVSTLRAAAEDATPSEAEPSQVCAIPLRATCRWEGQGNLINEELM